MGSWAWACARRRPLAFFCCPEAWSPVPSARPPVGAWLTCRAGRGRVGRGSQLPTLYPLPARPAGGRPRRPLHRPRRLGPRPPPGGWDGLRRAHWGRGPPRPEGGPRRATLAPVHACGAEGKGGGMAHGPYGARPVPLIGGQMGLVLVGGAGAGGGAAHARAHPLPGPRGPCPRWMQALAHRPFPCCRGVSDSRSKTPSAPPLALPLVKPEVLGAGRAQALAEHHPFFPLWPYPLLSPRSWV